MADVIAWEQILFWILPSSLCAVATLIVFDFIRLGGPHYLPVRSVPAPCNAQQNENSDKKPLCVEPLIQVVADSETKKD